MSVGILFNQKSIFDVRQNAELRAKNSLQSLLARGASIKETINETRTQWIREFSIHVPKLDVSKKRTVVTDELVDTPYDVRVLHGGDAPRQIMGKVIRTYIPFEGDGQLFHVRPSSFGINPPRGDVQHEELVIEFKYASALPNEQAIVNGITQTINSIQEYLNTLEGDVNAFNTQISQTISNGLEQVNNNIQGNKTLEEKLNS